MGKDDLASLRKVYPTMFLLSDDPLEVEAVSSGSIALDYALGVGGFPRGRISEIFGPESSGKTTLVYSTLVNAQRDNDKWVAFVDVEHVFDPEYAKNIGLNEERMVLFQPDFGEQALTFAKDCLESGHFSGVAVDSVAALVPKAELEGEIGDVHVGRQARMMSQTLRKITGAVRESQAVMLFTNQLRTKIGGYGNPETTPGGKALPYYASVRVRLSVTSTKAAAESSGRVTVRAQVNKNKVAPPYKRAEFDIQFGSGIDRINDVFQYARMTDVIEVRGGSYYYGEESLGRGKDVVLSLIGEDVAGWEQRIKDTLLKAGDDY